MNNLHKTIFAFFFIFLVSTNIFAETKNLEPLVTFHGFNSTDEKKFKEIIQSNIQLAQSFYPNKNLKLKINIENEKSKNKDSFSEEVNEYCSINLYYNSKNKYFFNKKDFDFIFLHELSHCILGYDKLYEETNWIIPLTNEEQNHFNGIIELLELLSSQRQNESDSLNTIQSGAPIPHPMIIYHEMFADIQSLDFLIHKTKDFSFAYTLKKLRQKTFNKFLISSSYASHFATPIYIDFLNKKIDNEEIKINYIVQLGFIKYLDFINTKYTLRKKNEQPI